MSNIRYIENLKLATNCNNAADVASEVTALKLAMGLLFARLNDADKNQILIELTQYEFEPFNKLSKELQQFMDK